jgi:mitochondrial import inner membrane translocase subunit TIM21
MPRIQTFLSHCLAHSRLPCSSDKFILHLRKFATHRDHVPSSLLSNVLDQKQRSAHREDSVGPFQLGLVQPTFGPGEKPQPKWSELSTSGKGMLYPSGENPVFLPPYWITF